MRSRAFAAMAPASALVVCVGAAAALVVAPRFMFLGSLGIGFLFVWYLGRAELLLPCAICGVLVTGFVTSRGLTSSPKWADVVGLFVLGAVLTAAWRWLVHSGRRPLGGGPASAALVMFLLIVVGQVVAALAEGEQRRAILGLRSWCFFPLLFFVAYVVASDSRAITRVVGVVSLAVAAVLAYGYKQFFLGYTPAELAVANANLQTHSVFYEGVPRLSSMLPTDQDFAAFVIVALPATLGFAVFAKGSRTTRAFAMTATTAAAGLAVLGMVRSAAIAAFIGSLVVLAVGARQRQRRVIAVVVALLIAAGVVQAAVTQSGTQGDAVGKRLQTLTSLASDPALNARLRTVWPSVARGILDRPLGHGVATTGGPAIKLDGPAAVIPDNGYLTLGYELGIPGALMYVAFLLLGGRAARRALRVRSKPVERAVALAAIGVVASVLLAMMGASYVQLPTLQVLLFPILGAAVRLSEEA